MKEGWLSLCLSSLVGCVYLFAGWVFYRVQLSLLECYPILGPATWADFGISVIFVAAAVLWWVGGVVIAVEEYQKSEV